MILSIYLGLNLIDKQKEQELIHDYAVFCQGKEIEGYLQNRVQAIQVLGEQVNEVYFSSSQESLKKKNLKNLLDKTANSASANSFEDVFLNCDLYQLSSNCEVEEVSIDYILAREALLWNNFSHQVFTESRFPVVSSLALQTNGEETIFIAVPLRTEVGNYYGYILATLNMEQLFDMLEKNQHFSSGYTILLDNKHQIIYHPDKGTKSSSEAILPVFKILKNVSEGSLNYYSPIYNREETANFATIADLDWVIWVAAPRFEVLLPFYRDIVLSLCTLLIGVFLILFIRDVLLNNIALPLSQLNNASEEFSAGNFSYRVKLDNKNIPCEIGELSAKFNTMAENLETSNALLKEYGSNLEKRVIERTKELVMKNKETAALYVVASSVSNTYKLTDVLNQVFNEIMKLFEVEFTIVHLQNDNKYIHNDDNKQVHSIWRVNYPQTEKLIYTEAVARYNQMAMEQRKIISITDLQKAEDEVPLALRWSDICSLVSIPICYQNTVLGAVTITSCSQNRFGKPEISILQAVCNQLGVVITNMGLFNIINEEHHTLLAIINSMNEGLLLLDSKGKILYVNPLFFKMFYLDITDWQNELSLVELKEKVNPEVNIKLPYEEIKECFLAQKVFEYGEGSVTYKDKIKYYLIQGFPVMTGETFIGYGCVVRDITREKEVDNLKSSILSTVSHELRSPLTTIYGSAESLLRKDVVWAKEEQQEFIEAIVEESIRLRELIDNIMDMSKIEAGALKIDLNATDLGKMIERIRERFVNRKLEQQIILDIPNELPCVMIDERRIEQVFNNLIENAIKYSPADQDIRIEVRYLSDKHMARVGVIDGGMGIDPQYQEAIFGRFYRVDNVRSKQIKGSGVGLSITKGIIEKHGGTIWVESELGQGSKFYFTLPCEKIEEERE